MKNLLDQPKENSNKDGNILKQIKMIVKKVALMIHLLQIKNIMTWDH